jgi:hypothetical protein
MNAFLKLGARRKIYIRTELFIESRNLLKMIVLWNLSALSAKRESDGISAKNHHNLLEMNILRKVWNLGILMITNG